MFFRRVFNGNNNKKDNSNIVSAPANGRFGKVSTNDLSNKLPRRTLSDEKQQKGLSVLQLTPLWEHIIRTGTLPEGLNTTELYSEFYERLHDPEWQVRQHALRVLIDVLAVMRHQSDLYIRRLMPPLVENLGHSAPAVRKGALDALRVYLTETRTPDTVILEIIDLGLEQKSSNDNFTGRLAVGVMLALPSLIQQTLLSTKRNYILKHSLHALSSKMVQVTYQDVALKSLLKIREMIGYREFNEFMPYKARKDFDLLCSVYGIPSSPANSRDSGIDVNAAPSSNDSRNSFKYVRNEFQSKSEINNDSVVNSQWHYNRLPPHHSDYNVNEIEDVEESQNPWKRNGNAYGKTQIFRNVEKVPPYVKSNSIEGTQCVENFPSDTSTSLEKKESLESSESSNNSTTIKSHGSLQLFNPIKNSSLNKSHGSLQVFNNTHNHHKSSKVMDKQNQSVSEVQYFWKFDPSNDIVDAPPTIISDTKPTEKIPPKRSTSSLSLRSKSATPTASPRKSISASPSREGHCTRSTSDTECTDADINIAVAKCFRPKECKTINPNDKVIMETEIQLSEDTAVTMRILESQVSHDTVTESEEELSARSLQRSNSIMRVMSDSEMEIEEVLDTEDATPRTPRRVRFGGEIVKMRTPDSDAHTHSDVDDGNRMQIMPITPTTSGQSTPTIEQKVNGISFEHKNDLQKNENNMETKQKCTPSDEKPINKVESKMIKSETYDKIDEIVLNHNEPITQNTVELPRVLSIEKSNTQLIETLHIDIPNDNTKPVQLVRPKTAVSPTRRKSLTKHPPVNSDSTFSTPREQKPQQQASETQQPTNQQIVEPLKNDTKQNDEPVNPINVEPIDKIVLEPSRTNSQMEQIKLDERIIPEIPKLDLFQPETKPDKPKSPKVERRKAEMNKPIEKSKNETSAKSERRPRSSSTSPGKRAKRFNVSYADGMLSPNPIHHEVQVLHNLMGSPTVSPKSRRKNSAASIAESETQTENPLEKSPTYNFSNFNQKFFETEEINRKRGTVQTQTSYELPVRNGRASQINQIRNMIPECSQTNEGLLLDIEKPTQEQQTHKPNQPKRWEELGIVDHNTLADLRSGDWRLRSRAIYALEDALRDSENLAKVQPYLESLLRTLLSSEKHTDVCEDKRRVLSNLISRLPLDNLESRVGQVLTGLCRQGGAGSNRVAKYLMQRLPAAAIVLRLLSDDFLHARSARFRENALQMVLYALMTFPSTYFDISTCVGRAAKAAIDRKKRVRQAALDVLAVLGQISSPKTVIDVVNSYVEHKTDGEQLSLAVKARLSRKQLPMVGSDGSVQYSLRIPSPQSHFSTHLFGADIEWIVAGSGSVSPTSLKKRTMNATQQQSFNYNTNNYPDGSYTNGALTKRYGHRPPHEMLAIGVGVNAFENQTSSGGNWRKYSGYHTDEENNRNFGVTAIPVQIASTQQINSDVQTLYNMKKQSRSFPELSDAVNIPHGKQQTPAYNKGRSSQIEGNCARPSRLPVTITRFPSMEQKFDSRSSSMEFNTQNKSTYQSFSVQKSTSSILSKTYTNSYSFHNDSHGPLSKQSSLDESNLPSNSTSDNSYSGPKKYYSILKTEPQTFRNKFIQQDEDSNQELQNENRPSSQNTNTTRSSSSASSKHGYPTHDNQRQGAILHIDNSMTDETTESDSDISTPTRDIESTQPSIQNVTKVEEFIQSSAAPLSRPQSVVAAVIRQEDTVDDHRPKTAATIISYDDIPIKSKMASKESILFDEHANKSRTTSRENVTPFDEIPIKSKASSRENISNVSRSSSVVYETNFHLHDNDVDEISSNSIETRSESDFDTDRKMDMSESYTPKTNRTNQSVLSSGRGDGDEIGSDKSETNDFDEVDFINEIPKSPIKKPKPVIFRNKKIVPMKSVPAVQKNKMVESKTAPTTKQFDKPKDVMVKCINQLDNPNWEVTMSGIQLFVRLIRHHPDLVESEIHQLTVSLAKHVKNLRSQVARAACQAAGEYFTTHKKALELESEELVTNLLHRTADTNKFLRADAGRALDAMCDNLPPQKVIHIVSTKGAVHQNAVVRTSAAKLFNRLVSRIGCDKVFAMNKEYRDKLILKSANLLLEGSLETRNYAKDIFKQLSVHNSYSKVIFEVIPQRTYRNIEKTLKSIK